ncbi:MAG: nucleotidyltransferase domain-containing protein [Nitrospirota bacterium]
MVNHIIVDILNREIKDLLCIYLFGSYIEEGKYKKDSDIDIAFLAEEGLDNITRWEISNILADKLKRDIDLIDLRGVSTVMKAQIMTNGLSIYESDKKKRENFEMLSLSDYARLNEERKEIIERIKREGLVYAR